MEMYSEKQVEHAPVRRLSFAQSTDFAKKGMQRRRLYGAPRERIVGKQTWRRPFSNKYGQQIFAPEHARKRHWRSGDHGDEHHKDWESRATAKAGQKRTMVRDPLQ